MVFGLESISVVLDKFFDFIVYTLFLPLIVFFFVALFFIMQYVLIKGYIFLYKEGKSLLKSVVDTYLRRKESIIERFLK